MIIGKQFAYGVYWDCPPLRGFPQGRVRVRMRDNQFVKVFVRPPSNSHYGG